ncbi:iron-siderophore ABC transporter substrate-binding protein [Nostoc sp. CHAB 5784]|uniref:iron-siderophore ABC transporter substrate-binding protein n=1 Tax=Nostoc mirabile TaxID=2907820 RepID=UPI001E3E96C1|nr:iron-siderophore ABC transporter substrate-binding protein [Nostoc mirabile]MCC5666141.1 iron-siderophore ABC transporter substrate-binding protein [Nostoc mirabile CHAB5784]
MSRSINNWIRWWRRLLRRFVSYGDRPHPTPPLAKGREQDLASPLAKGGLRGVKQWLLLSLLIIAIASACSSTVIERVPTPASEASLAPCRTVKHAMGETCIPQNPQRIVTLWMSTFGNTLALGIKPIATTQSLGEPLPKYLQGKADGVESVGTLVQPNLEKILLLKPDLILSMTRPYLENIYTQLSDIAPTVVMDISTPPSSWEKHLEDVASLFDKEQEKKQLIDQYWQRIKQLKQALGVGVASPKENRRHHLQVSVATVDQNYGIYTYGKKSPIGVVLNDIGLQRPSAQRGDFFTKSNISQENLSEVDGDVLFLSHWGGESGKEVLEKLKQSPLWQNLKVVQKNRVYFVDAYNWYGFDVLAMNAVIDDLFKYLVNTP